MTEGNKKNGSISGALNLITEFATLNFLTLIFCLPVVTAGASLTAMHTVMIKIIRNEEGYILKSFIGAFKCNFKKATLLWLPFLLIFASVIIDLMLIGIDRTLFPEAVLIPVIAAGLISFMIMQFVFPLQANFENTFQGIISNAFTLSTAYFPRTLVMAICALLPMFLASRIILFLPITICFGISVPGFISAKLYNPVFIRMEENEK